MSGQHLITPVLAVLAIAVAAVALQPGRQRAASAAARAPSRVAEVARRWASRRDDRHGPSARSVAAWCDDVARRVRSGSSLRDAITVVPADATTERATSPVRLALDRGLPISESVARVDRPGPHLLLALGVLATTSRIGGPSAASIDRTAMLLRQRAADLDERASHAAQARLSTHVMTAVPVLMLVLLAATDDDVRTAASSPVGVACVTAGLVLNATGWWWMRRIVGRSS